MPVRIVDTLGVIGEGGIKLKTSLKGYEGYIKSVNEYSKAELNLDPDQSKFQRKPIWAPVTHQTGCYCASGCPVCLPQRVSVDVALSAQGGRLEQDINISFIRPSK
jgi:hypothetical protein